MNNDEMMAPAETWRVPPPLLAPARFRLAVPSEVVTGPALVGRSVLFYWPTDGWVRGTVVRRSHEALASRPVRPAVGAGHCCVLFAPRCRFARPGGAVGAALPCTLAPAPRFSQTTVTAFRAGQASRPGKRENKYNGEHARDCCIDRA